jgi:hypothetical protein
MSFVTRLVRSFINHPLFSEAVQARVDRALAMQRPAPLSPDYRTSDHLKMPIDTKLTLFHAPRAMRMWGFLDLSAMRVGDAVEVMVHGHAGGEVRVRDRWLVEGYQEAPIFAIPPIEVNEGSTLTVRQTLGMPLELWYDLYGCD